MSTIKRIRDFANELNISLQQMIVIDDANYAANAEFKYLTLEQVLNLFLSMINFEDLELYILEPVKNIVSVLPEEGLEVHARYYIDSGEYAKSIAEWNGSSWDITSTKTGDTIYVSQIKTFIVITANGYDVGSNHYEARFKDVESIRVTHNLNRFPSVVVLNSDNELIDFTLTYVDRNTIEVTWTGRTDGIVSCN